MASSPSSPSSSFSSYGGVGNCREVMDAQLSRAVDPAPITATPSNPSSSSSSSSSTAVPPPPVLHFDDGSRAFLTAPSRTKADKPTSATTTTTAVRGAESEAGGSTRANDMAVRPYDSDESALEDKYELNRIVHEIRRSIVGTRRKREQHRLRLHRMTVITTTTQHQLSNDDKPDDGLVVQVAVQFPEAWIRDAPRVCHELERRWNDEMLEGDGWDHDSTAKDNEIPSKRPHLFAFCVGDSNDDDCCPDVDGAKHLPDTRFLVQFGPNACWTSTTSSSTSFGGGGKSKGRTQQAQSQPCCRTHEEGTDSNKHNETCCGATGADPIDDKESEGTADDDGDGLIVLRAFGRRSLNVVDCVRCIRSALTTDPDPNNPRNVSTRRRFLLLYDVTYRHAVDELQTLLSESMDALVVVGRIPSSHDEEDSDTNPTQDLGGGGTIVAGGLELPADLVDWPSYTVLYVGDPSSLQFLHISLRLQGTGIDDSTGVLTCDPNSSLTSQPTTTAKQVYIFPPMYNMTTGWSPQMSRFLKRRYYLVQKARSANTVGIVVAANVGGGGGGSTIDGRTSPVRHVMDALMRMLVDHGKSPYLYSVGRNVTVAKLSNFADLVECFVYVACPYGTIRTLQELDKHIAVPMVTPIEMAMALGCVDWNHCRCPSVSSAEPSPRHLGYSVDWSDFLEVANASASPPAPTTSRVLSESESEVTPGVNGIADNENDDDAPYFSLITGRYESSSASKSFRTVDRDLTALPGQGVLTRHASSAAEALQRREYKGLRPEIGETAIRAAIPGQKGIASDYGDR